MKKIIISLMLCLLTIAAFAQQSQTQSFYFKAGISFPLFDLANGNVADSSAGMASKGLHVEVGYNLPLSEHFGLGLAAEYYGNRYSHAKFTKYYGKVLSDASYGLSTSYAWSVGGFVLKPMYQVPIRKDVSLDVYGSGGFLAFFTPEFIVTTASMLNGVNETYHQMRSKGLSFTYGLGSRLNFKFMNTHFFLDADFMTSKISYHAIGTDWNNNSYSYPEHQKLGYLSINLGYTVFF